MLELLMCARRLLTCGMAAVDWRGTHYSLDELRSKLYEADVAGSGRADRQFRAMTIHISGISVARIKRRAAEA